MGGFLFILGSVEGIGHGDGQYQKMAHRHGPTDKGAQQDLGVQPAQEEIHCQDHRNADRLHGGQPAYLAEYITIFVHRVPPTGACLPRQCSLK